MKFLFEWFLNSFSGENKGVSSRRLTAFWFVVMYTVIVDATLLITFLILKKTFEPTPEKLEFVKDILIDSQYIACGMILLLLGIITIQQIIDFKTLAKTQTPPQNQKEDEKQK